MQSSQVNFEDLGKIVERDPALCLHLMKTAVEHNPECREQISGAASCLSLLGMQELVKLIKHLPVVEKAPADRQLQLYRRALHTAELAGELAAHWAASKGSSSESYARWSAMLTSAPVWIWLLKEELAQNWLHCLSRGQDLMPAVFASFGTNHLKDWQLLARQLSLPQLAMDCYRPQNWLNKGEWQLLRKHDPRDLDGHRALLHKMQQPHQISIMANSLAWNWHISPLGNQSKRWLALVSHWLGKPSLSLMPELRRLQLAVGRRQRDAQACGMALLLSPETCRYPYPLIVPPDPQPKPEKELTDQQRSSVARPVPDLDAPVERKPDTAYLKKLMRQLQQEPDSFGDWHYLMRDVLKGICQGVGLSSACIALLNRDKTALKVFYVEGIAEQDAIRRLNIDLRRPNLFKKLLEKPASLLLSAENRSKFLRGLPEGTSQLIPTNLVTMSIDAGAAPIGIVLAYNNQGKSPLTPAEYMAFKNLCQIASQSLSVLREKTEKQRRKEKQHKVAQAR